MHDYPPQPPEKLSRNALSPGVQQPSNAEICVINAQETGRLISGTMAMLSTIQ